MENRKRGASKKILFRILIIVIIICIALMAQFAWAKYMTSIKGNASADIAKWSLKVNGVTDKSFTINLASTRSGFEQEAEVNDGYIGPGTSGAFILELDATETEVSLEYNVSMNVDYSNNENFPKNLIFYRDEQMKNAMYYENNTINFKGFIAQGDENRIKTETIYWKWDFETGKTQEDIRENDEADSYWRGRSIEVPITVIGMQANYSSIKQQYSVTFDASGGTIRGYGNSKNVTKTVTEGSTYGMLPSVSLAGYTFAGWSGKNLLKMEDRVIRDPGGGWSNTAKRNFTGNGIYIGMTANNFYIPGTVGNNYSIDCTNNTVTVVTGENQAGYGVGFDFKVEPNTTYFISKSSSNLAVNIGEYSEDGTWLKMNIDNAQMKFTTTENTEWITIVIAGDGSGDYVSVENLQLEKNDRYTSIEQVQDIYENTVFAQQKDYTVYARWIKE